MERGHKTCGGKGDGGQDGTAAASGVNQDEASFSAQGGTAARGGSDDATQAGTSAQGGQQTVARGRGGGRGQKRAPYTGVPSARSILKQTPKAADFLRAAVKQDQFEAAALWVTAPDRKVRFQWLFASLATSIMGC